MYKSRVVSKDQVPFETEGWGTFQRFFTEDTYSLKDVLVGVAVIEPGHEIHPPHQHAEEEYLLVATGEGTWSVNGETFPAKTGDVLYTAPWEWHGITNTGATPMTFVVFKWNGKGVPVPDAD